MAISGEFIKINNQSVPALKQYKVSYSKLWKDSERNMNGDISASFIGIYPKIELVFPDGVKGGDIQKICGLLDTPYFSVTFYNPKTHGTSAAQYYAGDYTVEVLDRSRDIYKSFNVSLVPVSKA